ncbi:MAG: hypothetical protein P8Y09_12045, partial [Deltaproteobacteria bacterium]
YTSACEVYKKILDDTEESSYVNLIRCLGKDGKDDEVKKYSKDFLKLFPDSVYTPMIKANVPEGEEDETGADDNAEEGAEE